MLLTERDTLILDYLQDGPLSSFQIWKFTEHLKVNHFYLIKRLRALMLAGLIEKPDELTPKGIYGRYFMYTLTLKGKEALGEKRHRYAVPTAGGYPHMSMAATIVSHFRHFAGDRYISQEEILRAYPPAHTHHPLSIKTTLPKSFIGKRGDVKQGHVTVIADQLFGVDYGDDNCRFFAVEADRGTHTHDTLIEKVRAYKDVIVNKSYEKAWGIPCIYPLFITTSRDRAINLQKDAEQIFPNGSNYCLFGWLPGFLAFDKPPEIYPQLWNEPYLRAKRDPLDIRKAEEQAPQDAGLEIMDHLLRT